MKVPAKRNPWRCKATMAGAAIVAMVGSAFVSSTAGAQGSSTYTSKAGLAYAKAQVKKYSGR